MDGNIFAMLRIAVTPRMYPAFRKRLTRWRHGLGESPTNSAILRFERFPCDCITVRILRSMASRVVMLEHLSAACNSPRRVERNQSQTRLPRLYNPASNESWAAPAQRWLRAPRCVTELFNSRHTGFGPIQEAQAIRPKLTNPRTAQPDKAQTEKRRNHLRGIEL